MKRIKFEWVEQDYKRVIKDTCGFGRCLDFNDYGRL